MVAIVSTNPMVERNLPLPESTMSNIESAPSALRSRITAFSVAQFILEKYEDQDL